MRRLEVFINWVIKRIVWFQCARFVRKNRKVFEELR